MANTSAMATIFTLGCFFGWVCTVSFYTDGMAGNWATLIGAGGGAIITVLGLWWIETRKREEKDNAIALRMGPHLIALRGNLRQCNLLWKNDDNNKIVPLDHIESYGTKALNSWRAVQPMLDHFPDTAVTCYRLEQTFGAITEEQGGVADKQTALNALKYASELAERFRVDEIDLR